MIYAERVGQKYKGICPESNEINFVKIMYYRYRYRHLTFFKVLPWVSTHYCRRFFRTRVSSLGTLFKQSDSNPFRKFNRNCHSVVFAAVRQKLGNHLGTHFLHMRIILNDVVRGIFQYNECQLSSEHLYDDRYSKDH